MLKKAFAGIKAELEKSEKVREDQIQLSRETIRTSKLVIYAVHRDDMKKAASMVKKIKEDVKKLEKTGKPHTNMVGVALQEYVEAMCYYDFIKNNTIPTRHDLGVDAESYLLGLCDLSGELVRRAVNIVIKQKYKEALRIKAVVEEIYGEFLQFNLRNNELRRKSDQIKYNLKKLESLALDLHLKR